MDGSPQPPRRSRALATAFDAGVLLGALVVMGAVATAWLFVRTGAGRDDIRDLDARLAAAVVLAVPPAWFAWYLPGLLEGASSGQRRAGLEVQGTVTRRALRFALHPLALPIWAWLTLVVAAAGLQYVALALTFVVGLLGLLACLTLARWAAAPARRGLHDSFAGTRLVALPRRSS